MRLVSVVVGVLACGAASTYVAIGRAQSFRPFDDITSSCPKCPSPGTDKVTLKNGQVVEAVVVAENPMFYVLAKFGELRAVGLDQVAKLDRNPNAKRGTGHVDELLSKGGLVVSGQVVSDDTSTGYVEFASVGVATPMRILKSMVAVIFKSGKLYYSAK